MNEVTASVTWEAPEHMHDPKETDWYWVLGIVTLALVVAAVLLGNTLFGLLVLIGGVVVGIAASRPPKLVQYAITTRGIRIDTNIYPYSTLEAFYIDEEGLNAPQLLVRSVKMFMPLLILPIPPEYIDEIEEMVASRIPEEYMEEPLASRVLDILGF